MSNVGIITNQKIGNSTQEIYCFDRRQALFRVEPRDASWVIVADVFGQDIVLRDFGSQQQAIDEFIRMWSVEKGALNYTYFPRVDV